ncbi:UDP-N-acetylglucosamine transferase subunit alg14 [Pseudocercospora fuligena]|uniref:UDP-N-acetylglucosamine transferase subunit ALG14 n=1 Tax=Pseudocercospora fuligena TaxID=685502 RepID=A0A8H6RD84_9PEZI|nr:UDP-N-acetylglucosamine transferase subunit alg14 [Pseudocercospora fuligena]
MLEILVAAALILLTTAILAVFRFKAIIDPNRPKPLRHGRQNPEEPTHLLIVLGSGGHTAEMLGMLERAVTEKDYDSRVDWRDFTHRTWVVSSGDGISAERAYQFEEKLAGLSTQTTLTDGKDNRVMGLISGTYDIVTVPRAREIHQPAYTAPISCLKCLWTCVSVLTSHTTDGQLDFPDLILCNGPATATILIFTSILLRFFNIRGCSSRHKMRTLYIESWARVKRLSLSGRLLLPIVDKFLVQWPQLEKIAGSRAEYHGPLV